MYDRENLRSVWRNVMNERKQLEFEELISLYDCAMCAINGT